MTPSPESNHPDLCPDCGSEYFSLDSPVCSRCHCECGHIPNCQNAGKCVYCGTSIDTDQEEE